MQIEIEGISKSFGTFQALRNVSLTIPDGQLVALLGPSGSGKTTVLRIIAGLEAADSGRVAFGNAEASHLAPNQRRVGFVFQHYALFRHMSVFENIAFGLRVKPRKSRPSENEIKLRVNSLLNLIQLESQADRLPSQLSGGQRQRVALARALAVEPQVLLLDEPFGALDAKVRQDLRRWLRRLHDELHITSVFVTHDVDEALEVADQIVVMNEGKIEQVGTPDHVYEHPVTPFVYRFLGSANVFPMLTTGAHGAASPAFPAISTTTTNPGQRFGCARPHELELSRTMRSPLAIAAIIDQVLPIGPIVRIHLRQQDSGAPLEAELSKDLFRLSNFKAGEAVYVHPVNLQYFQEDYSI